MNLEAWLGCRPLERPPAVQCAPQSIAMCIGRAHQPSGRIWGRTGPFRGGDCRHPQPLAGCVFFPWGYCCSRGYGRVLRVLWDPGSLGHVLRFQPPPEPCSHPHSPPASASRRGCTPAAMSSGPVEDRVRPPLPPTQQGAVWSPRAPVPPHTHPHTPVTGALEGIHRRGRCSSQHPPAR